MHCVVCASSQEKPHAKYKHSSRATSLIRHAATLRTNTALQQFKKKKTRKLRSTETRQTCGPLRMCRGGVRRFSALASCPQIRRDVRTQKKNRLRLPPVAFSTESHPRIANAFEQHPEQFAFGCTSEDNGFPHDQRDGSTHNLAAPNPGSWNPKRKEHDSPHPQTWRQRCDNDMKTKILQTKHPRTSKGNTNLFPKHTKQPHNTSGQHAESKEPDLVSTITPSMFLRPTFVSRLGPPVAPNRSDRITARCATDQRHSDQQTSPTAHKCDGKH